MPPDHPLASAGKASTHSTYPKLDLSLLAEEPFILHFPEQTTGQLSLEALKAAHIKPYVPIQSRNTETCVKLCHAGTWYVLHSRNLCPKYGPPCKTSLLFRW